jgi:hypothetical protein
MLEIPSSSPCVPSPETHPASSDPDLVCALVSRCVACDFALEPGDLEAASRGPRRAVLARQIAMYLAHVGFALSFEAIGRAFGRDRTTVAHACRTVEDRRDDIWFDCRLATLELICRAALDGDVR